MPWRGREEEEDRTAAAEAVEAREPGVFRLGREEEGGGMGVPRPTQTHVYAHTRTHVSDTGDTHHTYIKSNTHTNIHT